MKVTRLSSGADDPDTPRPTLKEVAALAGVSWKTVSRVVNAEPGVSEAMATRVRRAARQLGYRPNMAASSLRRSDRRTASMALLLQNLSNPFSASLLRAVEDVARTRGVAVIAASVDEDEQRERRLVEEFVDRRVDGLIVAPVAADQSFLLSERRAGLAVVCVDRKPGHLDVDAVVVDNVQGAYDGTAHLLAHGHRRIAFIGDHPSIVTATLRLEGYRRALHDQGVPNDESLYLLDVSSERFGYETTLSMLNSPAPPTAVFAGQNFITMGALRALAERGLRHQVALLGFDDFPLADLLDPPVTVVAQDVAKVGHEAARLLFARIDGDTSPTRQVVLPTHLISRGSGEIPRALADAR